MSTIEMPDGKGGWKKIEAETISTKRDPSKMASGLAQFSEKEYFERIGKFVEALDKFGQEYTEKNQITKEEVAGAYYLQNLNIRQNWKEGKKDFDSICSVVGNWFNKNV